MVVPKAFRLRSALLVGGGLSVVRLVLFWAGVTMVAEYADWRQVAGYAVLIFNSVVEIGIASAWTHNRVGGSRLAAGLIVLTSAALGWGWERRSSRKRLR